MFYGILRDTPIYQEMTRRSRAEEARRAFLLVGENKFPSLSPLATKLATLLEDVNVINELLVKISLVQDVHEAELLLLQEIKKHE